jgi:hypothetical protein
VDDKIGAPVKMNNKSSSSTKNACKSSETGRFVAPLSRTASFPRDGLVQGKASLSFKPCIADSARIKAGKD